MTAPCPFCNDTGRVRVPADEGANSYIATCSCVAPLLDPKKQREAKLDAGNPDNRPPRPTGSIGGTDVAVMAGDSAYNTRAKLFIEFTAGSPPSIRPSMDTSPLLYRGLYLEPVIRQLAWDKYRIDVGESGLLSGPSVNGIPQHGSYDGLDPEYIHEFKTVVWSRWKTLRDGDGEVFEDWKWQGQHYMELGDRRKVMYHVLEAGYWHYQTFTLDYDDTREAKRHAMVRSFTADVKHWREQQVAT